jgi:hypothetical protein
VTTSALTRASASAKPKARADENIGLVGESGLMDAQSNVMRAIMTTARDRTAVIHISAIARFGRACALWPSDVAGAAWPWLRPRHGSRALFLH